MNIAGVHDPDHEGHDEHEGHEESRKKRSLRISTPRERLMSNIRKRRSIQENIEHETHHEVKVKFSFYYTIKHLYSILQPCLLIVLVSYYRNNHNSILLI